ncbi:hypothetical protein [Nonomuraea sp. NPDC050310]|uniref:hypothetical protein n=1 Tax=Nonomuraea sp. NPDC050310 TaxID=3154935 RepID=UPI0033E8D4C3
MKLLVMAALAASTLVGAPPEADYWRVETIHSRVHPHQVGSGYWVREKNVAVEWLTPQGKAWSAYRPLGAHPASKADEAAWKADGSPKSWTYRTEGMKITLSTEPGKGTLGPAKGRPDGFQLVEKYVTYAQLQDLPAEPAALKARVVADLRAWMAEAAEEAKTTSPGSKVEDWTAQLDRYTAGSLARLLVDNPVPKPVRAAAYQALRTVTKDLGPGRDLLGRSGRLLALPVLDRKGTVLKQEVLVDTTAMLLLEQRTATTVGGKPVTAKSGVETYKAGWTDARPALPTG